MSRWGTIHCSMTALLYGKINWSLYCDFLPKQARWHYFVCSGLHIVSCKKKCSLFPSSCNKFFIDKACLVKMARYWHTSVFIDLDSVSVHKHAKRNLANIQTSWPRLFNNPYVLILSKYLLNHLLSFVLNIGGVDWFRFSSGHTRELSKKAPILHWM